MNSAVNSLDDLVYYSMNSTVYCCSFCYISIYCFLYFHYFMFGTALDCCSLSLGSIGNNFSNFWGRGKVLCTLYPPHTPLYGFLFFATCCYVLPLPLWGQRDCFRKINEDVNREVNPFPWTFFFFFLVGVVGIGLEKGKKKRKLEMGELDRH